MEAILFFHHDDIFGQTYSKFVVKQKMCIFL